MSASDGGRARPRWVGHRCERGLRFTVTSIVTVFAVALAGLAHARGTATAGSMAGTVLDPSRKPIGNAQVVAISPTQIGGAKTAVSNDDGSFRFLGLMPGTFLVRVTAEGFKHWQARDVVVRVGSAAVVDVVLEAGSWGDEDVIVSNAAHAVETGKANVGARLEPSFIRDLPRASDGYESATSMVAGARNTGSGGYEIRGGSKDSNRVSIDGFDTNDPMASSFGMDVAPVALADVNVLTAGYGAEGAAIQGGLVNVLTRSGSNRVALDTRLSYTGTNLRLRRDGLDTDTNLLAAASLGVGGAVVRNRLWYYVSGQGIHSTSNLGPDPSGATPEHPGLVQDRFAGLGKITFQATARQKLQALIYFSPADASNVLQQRYVASEAEAHGARQDGLLGLAWEMAPRNEVFLRVQAGLSRNYLRVSPESCQSNGDCENTAVSYEVSDATVADNYWNSIREARRTAQLGADLDWFPRARLLGRHGIKVGVGLKGFDAPMAASVPGDAVYRTLRGAPYNRSEVCANEPARDGGACRGGWLLTHADGAHGVVFLSDAWQPVRYLTITPGLSVQRGVMRDAQDTVTDLRAATPHLAVAWDATHDGRTVLRGSFNQYVDTGSLEVSRFVGRRLASRTCFWDAESRTYTDTCSVQTGTGDSTVGFPEGPEAVDARGEPIRRALDPPRVSEYTLGAEREVVAGVTAAADIVHRRFEHGFEDVETNLIWNESGTNLRADGGYKDGKAHHVFDLETPDSMGKRYQALTVTVQKVRGRLRILGSYTWARFEGPENSVFAGSYLDNPKNARFWYGPLPGDNRHDVRLHGSYAFTNWLGLGASFRFKTGDPYNRWFYNPVFGGFYDLRSQRGRDPRSLNDPLDDEALRLPSLMLLDLRLRTSLEHLLGQRIDIWVDLFNAIGARTTTAVIETDGPAWGSPSLRLPPARVRFGLEYRL